MTQDVPEYAALHDLILVAIAPLLWAVYPADCTDTDTAVGRIDCDGTRFHVGLDGDEIEVYSFATLRESTTWFAEYLSALTLGSGILCTPDSDRPGTRIANTP
jgi:hypothetical protein